MSQIDILKIIITTSILGIVRAELEVTQVQVLFRHGERTPLLKEMYPNDIHNVSEYEPWGLAQLTNTGKLREYRIGQVLRTRYPNLLGPHYIPTALYAVSTDVDRTKMSLQLVLAGLFPPSEAEIWHSEIPWIPIPIHSLPGDLDVVLEPFKCPEFINGVTQVLQLPEVQIKIGSHQDVFEFLEIQTGLNLTKPSQVYEIYNLLVAQKAMNLTLPEWCTDAVLTEMSEITVLNYEIRSYTTELKRISGGQLVVQLIENMHLDKEQENPRKIYLYSGHESTIAAFLRALRITELRLPLYGTAVMLEKLIDTEGKLFVRLVLWTGVTEQLITLRIPGCEETCPIERFLQLTREVIPSDEERNCHWRRLSASTFRKATKERLSFN